MTTDPDGTLRGLMAQARQLGVDRLDAQALAAHRLGRSRAWLVAHDDEPLAPHDLRALAGLLARRAAGEPLAYLVGEREFHGMSLTVTPAVLVPRPDTETLVDWALELLAGPLATRPSPGVLDLGTGSGAIALAVARGCARARVQATDRDPAALRVAQANGERLGLAVHWQAGAWWAPLDGQQFDLVMSNPPYVAPGDAHLAALRHEPRAALVPDGDDGQGLADLRRIVADAPAHLTPGGWLLLEHGFDQAEAVAALLTAAGFVDVATRRDLGSNPRVTAGRRAAA